MIDFYAITADIARWKQESIHGTPMPLHAVTSAVLAYHYLLLLASKQDILGARNAVFIFQEGVRQVSSRSFSHISSTART